MGAVCLTPLGPRHYGPAVENPPFGRFLRIWDGVAMSSSGKDSEPGQGEISPQEREAFRKRASELGNRLDQVKSRKGPTPEEDRARGAAYGQATKIAAELVAGVGVGGFIGWALDRQFGTAPGLLILFLLLGFAAGLTNVVRTARRMQAEAETLQRAARPAPDDEDDA